MVDSQPFRKMRNVVHTKLRWQRKSLDHAFLCMANDGVPSPVSSLLFRVESHQGASRSRNRSAESGTSGDAIFFIRYLFRPSKKQGLGVRTGFTSSWQTVAG